MRVKGRQHVRVVAQGGDGGTTDIGLGCLSGMFERNDDVLYICYDNEAYMNTGVQRSSATPASAQSFQGSGSGVGATITTAPATTNISVTTQQTVIDWTPSDGASGGVVASSMAAGVAYQER